MKFAQRVKLDIMNLDLLVFQIKVVQVTQIVVCVMPLHVSLVIVDTI